jgi:phosphatidylglycerophosphate synthase
VSGTQGEARDQSSVLAGVERRVLDWIIPRLPGWVTPDLLTGGALLAMAIAGFAYAGASERPWLLHVVNACLFIHWFGDSTDGGLARHGKRSRPRYGFYVDHMSDAVGAFFLSIGAALSGIMSPWLAVLLVVLYLLLAVHSYLSTYALGVFHLSYGGVGPTELRLALGLLNLLVLWTPTVTWNGRAVYTFDLVGIPMAVALAAILVFQIARTTARLHRMERI